MLSSSSVVQVFATMESDIIKHHSCLTWIDLEKMCACIFGFNILHDVLIWFMIVNQSSSRWPQPQQMTGDFLLEPPMAPPVTFDTACFVTKLGSVTKNERDKCIRSVQSPKRPEVSPHQLKQIPKENLQVSIQKCNMKRKNKVYRSQT